ncbi:56c1e2d0-dccf-4b85-8dcf-3630b5a29030 [Thermothielavioides terrestris]|nr:56c1e2d0-dccf-4b85-8dcf-3630b5a29030 [Thermothielavioides terrestris]
MSVLPIF